MDIDTVLKTIYNAKEVLKGYQITTNDGKVYSVQNKDVPKTSTVWKGSPPVATHVILPDKTKIDSTTIVKVKII